MTRDVKRTYRSERRRRQAEETRVAVLDAAAPLFEQLGYEATTITAIAEDAGLAPETVYAHFKNKRTLLGELVARAVRGNDPRPVPEQEAPRAIASTTDQREQLRLFAADIVVRLGRAAPLVTVVGGAARSDRELSALLARLHKNRLTNLRTLVDALAANGPLRLPAAEAAETVWALTSPELHQLLVGTRGWSARRYRDWLARTLEAVLLPPRADRSTSRR